jgi:hypothetical protein
MPVSAILVSLIISSFKSAKLLGAAHGTGIDIDRYEKKKN